MKTIICSILAVSLLLSCQTENKNLKDYYYPMDELTDGLVYEYRSPVGDNVGHPPYYWLYQKVQLKNGAEVLRGVYYNHNMQIEQMVTERILDSGVETAEFQIYEYDATGKALITEPEINQNEVFSFEANNTKVLPFIINWRSRIDAASSTTLTRGRVFQSYEKCAYKGKQQDCARFLVADQIEADHDTEGGQHLDIEATELYAKGIGLVYSKKTTGDLEIIYELVDRYDLKELERRVGM